MPRNNMEKKWSLTRILWVLPSTNIQNSISLQMVTLSLRSEVSPRTTWFSKKLLTRWLQMEVFGSSNLIQFTDLLVYHSQKWKTSLPSNNSSNSLEIRSRKSSRMIRKTSHGLMSLSSGLKRTLVDACPSQVIQNKRKRSRRLQSIILPTLMMKMRIQSKQENQLRWLRRNFNIDSSSMLERKSITKRLWQVDKSHSNRWTSRKAMMRNLVQLLISPPVKQQR